MSVHSLTGRGLTSGGQKGEAAEDHKTGKERPAPVWAGRQQGASPPLLSLRGRT